MAFALLAVVIGLLLAIFKPVYYVLFFGLFGSDMESFGFIGYFRQFIPLYDTLMLCLLVVATASAIIRGRRQLTEYQIKEDMKYSYYMMVFSSLSVIISFLFTDVEGNAIIRVVKAITLYSPAIMIIWFKQRDSILNGKNLLFKYLCVQCVISFCIIYLSRAGFTFFNSFNSGYYNGGYFYTNEYNDMVALPSNFYLVFIQGKNANFIRTAQFHNSNGLGFAAGTLLFLCIEKLFVTKIKGFKKISCILVAIMSFLLWCCSGTRGVLFGMLLGLFVYYLRQYVQNKGKLRSIWSALLIFIFSLGIIVIIVFSVFDNILNSYLLTTGFEASFNSRNTLLTNFINSFFSFVLIGNGGDLDTAVSLGIDPHILSLRILLMYGIIPAVLMFIITFWRPFKRIANMKVTTLYSIGLSSIIILVGSTNNLTAVVLFWIVLSESICRINQPELYDE